MDRSPVQNPRPLIVVDAAAPGAAEVYERELAAGAELVVHGDAPWARVVDSVDVGTAAFVSLYADRVVGGGLPALLGR